MPVLSPMPLAQNRENGSRRLRQTLPEGIQRIVQSESCGRDEDEVSWKGWGGAATPSFKRDDLGKDAAGNDRGGRLAALSGSLSLEAIEKRFTWYRNKLLRSVQLRSDRVFPPRWNVHYCLTVLFLEAMAQHLKTVLKRQHVQNNAVAAPSSGSVDASALAASIASIKLGGGGTKPHSPNSAIGEAVTALLKALQKTILFKKEMSTWLIHNFGTKFADPLPVGTVGRGGSGIGVGVGVCGQECKESDTAGGGNDLEFNDRGHAIPARSAKGIRIKYERRRRMAGKGIEGCLAPRGICHLNWQCVGGNNTNVCFAWRCASEAKGRRGLERDEVGNVVVDDTIVVVKNHVVKVSIVVQDIREVEV